MAVLLAGGALFLAGSAEAADLRGAVTDANTGRLLEGASVRVVQTGRVVATDRSGAFGFTGLAPGAYTVTADFVGYRRVTQTVQVTETGVAEINLRIGAEMEVEGIVVTSTRAAQAEALQVKRSATGIVDAISATDVGKLPDNNAADALQRLPGVTVTIDQGEGRYVIVRGMDSNLVNVTVNGQVFPGPEGGARRVALDTFPSDIIARLEVVKAQTPDLDANAIGGTVNIVTPSAFDTPDGFVRAAARIGYNQLGETENYAANASVAHLFGSDRQFGVVAGASFSRRKFESDNYEGAGFRLVNGQSLPTTRVLRDYRILRERTGVFGNFEWRPTEAVRLYVNNTYTRYADDEQRDSTTFEYALGTLSAQTATGGRYSQGRGTLELRDRKVVQTLYNVSAGGEYSLGQLTLDGNLTFAQANEDTPKRIDWEFRSATGAFPNTYDASGLFLKTDAPALFDATKYPFRRLRTRTDDVSEQTVAVTGNVRYEFTGRPGFVKAGVRYVDRDKSWDRTNRDYTGVTGTFLLSDISRRGATDHLGDNYNLGPVIDRQRITDYFNANTSRFLPDAATTLSNSLVTDFDAAEKVTAAYGMGEVTLGGVILTGGVRVEHTKATYSSYDIQRRGGVITGFPIRTGGTKYTHVLPDVLARYNVGDNLVLRAAFTNTIGRPNYTDIVPRRDFDAAEVSPGIFQGAYSEGNPDLKPYKSQNLDASVEYYLRPAGIISVGVFHKEIDNPIYGRTINQVNVAFEGRQFSRLDVTRPENADSGELTGLEINYQQQFTFLPGLLRGFGVAANLTLVDSKTNVFGRTDELPFFRQSDRLANGSIFYELGGFEGRLAITHRSPYLEAVVSPGFDAYVATRTQVDLKFSYAINERFSVSADILNVNNAPLRVYSDQKNRILQEERYGPSASIGINAKF
jgi:TonB-dependent receptor